MGGQVKDYIDIDVNASHEDYSLDSAFNPAVISSVQRLHAILAARQADSSEYVRFLRG